MANRKITAAVLIAGGIGILVAVVAAVSLRSGEIPAHAMRADSGAPQKPPGQAGRQAAEFVEIEWRSEEKKAERPGPEERHLFRAGPAVQPDKQGETD